MQDSIVRSGRLKNLSAAFFHPEDPSNPRPGIFYLRHIGMLGAQPPAVKGLARPVFSECLSITDMVCFSEAIAEFDVTELVRKPSFFAPAGFSVADYSHDEMMRARAWTAQLR